MSKKTFKNAKRNRYYGLRVGDIVSPKGLQGALESSLGKCKVIGYAPFDNNRVYIQSIETGEETDWVAEWCEIITKVEDIKDTVEINASIIANYKEVVNSLISIAIYNENKMSFQHKKQDVKVAVLNLATEMGVEIIKTEEEAEKTNPTFECIGIVGALSLLFINKNAPKKEYSDIFALILRYIEQV